MPSTPPAQPLLADLDTRIVVLSDRVRRATDGVDVARRSAIPATGGWSMDQVLEHVMKVDEDYLRVVREVASAAPRGAAREWKPTLLGRLIVWAMREQNRMKAPTAKAYDHLVPRADAPAAFQRHLESLAQVVRESDALDLRALRVRSPIQPALVINLGDTLLLLVSHAERHAGQLERVRAAVAG